MFINEMIRTGKTKYKIVTEENVFFLSERELLRYGLKQEEELSDEVYEKIRKEVLLPSAKKKAMDLLLRADHSEKELRGKLAIKGFPEDIVEEAIQYVKGFNYINDERYAENYVTYRGRGKSKRQIKMELQRKGIDQERAEELIAEAVDEEETVMRLIKKRIGERTVLEAEERRKLMAFFFRRGFDAELIRSALRRLEVQGEEERAELSE